MAPTRPVAKTKQKTTAAALKKRAEARTTLSPTQLLANAAAALDNGDVETAIATATRALEDAGSARIAGALHSLLGSVFLELSEPDQARTHFEQATQADPEGLLPDEEGGGPEKFCYLAQLSEQGGEDSIRWFEKGAEALRKRISAVQERINRFKATTTAPTAFSLQDEAEAATLRRRLAETLCAMAEVYMTDLSLDPTCETACERLVTEAVATDETSVDAWQTLGSVRLSQERVEESRAALTRSLGLWWRDEDIDDEEADESGLQEVPPFAVRVSLVRLLLTADMLDEAIAVVELLLGEDESAVEVWYLGGWAMHLLGEKAKENEGKQKGSDDEETGEDWQTSWRTSRRMLRRCRKVYNMMEYEDDRLLSHVEELLTEIDGALGPIPEGEEDAEDEDEWEGWEDDDEDEEMKD